MAGAGVSPTFSPTGLTVFCTSESTVWSAPTPLGPTTSTYTSANLPATITAGKGQVQSYTYDALGRTFGIAYANPDGTLAGSIGYTYGADGDVLSMSDPTGNTTYTPNALNQLAQQSYTPTGKSAETSAYTWDGAGNLKSKTDSGGTITYTYTPNDQVQTVTDRQNHTYTLGYDQNGNRTSIASPTGVTEQMSYDGNDSLTRIWATKGSSTLTSFSYAYTNPATNQQTLLPYSPTDVINTSVSEDNVNSSWAYQYDPLNRLASATETGTPSNTYSYGYDPASNLTSVTTNRTQTTQSFNAANEMTQSGSTTYTYDANGNRTSSSAGQALTYNALSQTTSITPPGGSAITAAYADVGQARRTTFGQGAQQYDVTGMDILTFPTISITPGLPPPPPPGPNDLTSSSDGLNLSDQTSSAPTTRSWMALARWQQ